MVIFFGPAGTGKSVQGQILAARHEWRWLSAGQLLRDTHDPKLIAAMQSGKLVDHTTITTIMGDAIKRAKNIDRIILDGFPRQLEQAEWLVKSRSDHGRVIDLVIVLEVPKSDLLRRLEIRGRADDLPDAIDERLRLYREEIYPILGYFTEQRIPIVHLDGTGTVGQVHDKIMEELQAHKLVK